MTSVDKGADPEVIKRTRPPRAVWTALNTNLSQMLSLRMTCLDPRHTATHSGQNRAIRKTAHCAEITRPPKTSSREESNGNADLMQVS